MGAVCCNEEKRQSNEPPAVKKVANTNSNSNQKPMQNNSPGQPSQKITNTPTAAPTLVKHGAENYQSIKYLGRGTFGDVVLAEDKQNNIQYAMKIIDKRKIKEFNVLQSQRIRKIS